MSDNFYETLAVDYDRMIPWEKRLRNECPHFEALWSRFAVRSVLDASCGTGHHLVLFAQMGLEVAGADASPEMVALARRLAAEAGLDLNDRLYSCPWSALSETVPDQFGAVLCIGNSFPYVRDPAEMRRSLAGLWSRVAPGGILLLQFKNFARLYATRQRFLPLTSTPPPREMIFLRQYDYHPDFVMFGIVLLEKSSDGSWSLRHQETPLHPYRPQDLVAPLKELGAQQVDIYGSLALTPFDEASSEDAVILARG